MNSLGTVRKLSELLGVRPSDIPRKLEALKTEVAKLEQELKGLKG